MKKQKKKWNDDHCVIQWQFACDFTKIIFSVKKSRNWSDRSRSQFGYICKHIFTIKMIVSQFVYRRTCAKQWIITNTITNMNSISLNWSILNPNSTNFYCCWLKRTDENAHSHTEIQYKPIFRKMREILQFFLSFFFSSLTIWRMCTIRMDKQITSSFQLHLA